MVAVRWALGTQFKLWRWLHQCSSLTVTAEGNVVTLERTKSILSSGDGAKVTWYDKDGALKSILDVPCQHIDSVKILAVEVGGAEQVVLSCPECQCIWVGPWYPAILGRLGVRVWKLAWEASGWSWLSSKREEQPKPRTMCQGKPGQIIAINSRTLENVCMFDVKDFPFHLVVPQLNFGMEAKFLCYCDLPGVGGTLAVTEGGHGRPRKLCMFSLDSGEFLWSVGGQDEEGQGVKVAGAEFYPEDVCTDNRGRLYVADLFRHRIVVFSASSGAVLQVVQGRGHWEVVGKSWWGKKKYKWVGGVTVYGADIKYKNDKPAQVESGTVLQEFRNRHLEYPRYLCWHEGSKSIIVYHYTMTIDYSFTKYISYYHLF